MILYIEDHERIIGLGRGVGVRFSLDRYCNDDRDRRLII